MNIIFMRHGEAIDNVRGILSCYEEQCSLLTSDGMAQVVRSVESIDRVDKIYSSPLIRTLQTAKEASRALRAPICIDERIKEIDWGSAAGHANNKTLDAIRQRQVEGDFFVRFGKYGENRFEVEQRLCEFLYSVSCENFAHNTVLIVSHGTIISFMKRILGLASRHAKKGQYEEFKNIDFSNLRQYRQYLDTVKEASIEKRLKIVSKVDNKRFASRYREMARDFLNSEFPESTLRYLVKGLTDQIAPPERFTVNGDGPVLICLFKNFKPFVNKWFSHYIHLGVKNFVLLNNNSTDESLSLIKEIAAKANIRVDVWNSDEEYNCFRACGWRQQVMEQYGHNRWYLNVDSDELFVFSDTMDGSIEKYIEGLHDSKSVKALMLDVYSKHPLFADCSLDDFIYFDKIGYRKDPHKSYGERVAGGPRRRIFGLESSIQKVPLVYYTGDEVIANDHYLYPWNLNTGRLSTVLLHFKFIPGSLGDYEYMAKSKVHWNKSKAYRIYLERYKEDKSLSLYSPTFSESLENLQLDELLK